jgi:hemerythrin superfamily protein
LRALGEVTEPEHCLGAAGLLIRTFKEALMASNTRDRTTDKTSESKRSEKSGERRLFDWDNWDSGNAGILVGAAVAGAALGLAANMGRKLLVQAASASSGDWVETLKTEHAATLAIFDKIEATDDSQTTQRSALLAKLKYALSKHAIQEEMVVYPALRQANFASDADHLGEEHGYVKTYLYELETMAKDNPEWLARVRDFRAMIQGHMREEEDDIFPTFRARLSDDQNAKITTMMNKEGFKFA